MKKFCVVLFVFAILCLSIFAQIPERSQYGIEQYLNIRSAGSPTFSPDGKRIAFLTNITGTNQIWFVDANSGYPEQITAYKDDISFVEWLADGKGLIFGKAVGGNENTQFFWISDDGSNIRQLTNDEKTRHNFGAVSKDGTRIFYTSNKRNKNWFDVYQMEIAGGKEEMLWQTDSSNFIAAVSDNGDRVVVSRSSVRFSLDNDLYLIDAKTKQTKHLTPHDEAAQYSDVHFLPDNKTLVFGTNEKREFYNLAEMSLKGDTYPTATEIADKVRVIDNTNWDLDASQVSPHTDLFAYTTNREGFSELFLRKIETDGKPLISTVETNIEQIVLPAKGIVGGMEFSRDGKKLAFVFNSPKHPSDIWTYDFASEKLTQVTKSSTLGISRDSFVEPELIKYKTFDGREISAWYYKRSNYPLPKGTTFSRISMESDYSELKIPRVIVSVHGGPASQARPQFNALYQYYLSRGYAILEPNVRGSTGYGKTFSHLDDIEKREDSVKDLAYAVEWLKKEGGADEKRIAVMGGSYGGYMVMAAITLYPDMFAAAVNTVGIVNWETFLKNTSGYRRTQREVEYGFLDKNLEFLRSVSPIYKVDKIKTPLFVIHGKNDPRVPYTEAEQLVEALKKRNATVQYELFDDEGHGIRKLENRLELYPKVAEFLDKYLK
jgi:dipeptidyl aminopeptidase/acylaminoacyl peptidase